MLDKKLTLEFEEQYTLSNPKTWRYLDSVEAEEAVSYAFCKIDFKDEKQNQYYQQENDKYKFVSFPTSISQDELNENGIYVDKDGYSKDINEYEIGFGSNIYRIDGFDVTDYGKLCLMLSVITDICHEFEKSPSLTGLNFFHIFEFGNLLEIKKIDEKPEIYNEDLEQLGNKLAEWYFDFFEAPKIFEEKFNKFISDNEFVPGIKIEMSNFEITEHESVADSLFPKEVYVIKCKIHMS